MKVVERNLRVRLGYGYEINKTKQNNIQEMGVNLVYYLIRFYHFSHRNETLEI